MNSKKMLILKSRRGSKIFFYSTDLSFGCKTSSCKVALSKTVGHTTLPLLGFFFSSLLLLPSKMKINLFSCVARSIVPKRLQKKKRQVSAMGHIFEKQVPKGNITHSLLSLYGIRNGSVVSYGVGREVKIYASNNACYPYGIKKKKVSVPSLGDRSFSLFLATRRVGHPYSFSWCRKLQARKTCSSFSFFAPCPSGQRHPHSAPSSSSSPPSSLLRRNKKEEKKKEQRIRDGQGRVSHSFSKALSLRSSFFLAPQGEETKKEKKLKVGDICVLKISALGPNGMGIDEYTYACSIFVPTQTLGDIQTERKIPTTINLGNIIKAKIIKINYPPSSSKKGGPLPFIFASPSLRSRKEDRKKELRTRWGTKGYYAVAQILEIVGQLRPTVPPAGSLLLHSCSEIEIFGEEDSARRRSENEKTVEREILSKGKTVTKKREMLLIPSTGPEVGKQNVKDKKDVFLSGELAATTASLAPQRVKSRFFSSGIFGEEGEENTFPEERVGTDRYRRYEKDAQNKSLCSAGSKDSGTSSLGGLPDNNLIVQPGQSLTVNIEKLVFFAESYSCSEDLPSSKKEIRKKKDFLSSFFEEGGEDFFGEEGERAGQPQRGMSLSVRQSQPKDISLFLSKIENRGNVPGKVFSVAKKDGRGGSPLDSHSNGTVSASGDECNNLPPLKGGIFISKSKWENRPGAVAPGLPHPADSTGLGIVDLKDGYKLIIPNAKISNNVVITVTRVKSKYAFAKIEKTNRSKGNVIPSGSNINNFAESYFAAYPPSSLLNLRKNKMERSEDFGQGIYLGGGGTQIYNNTMGHPVGYILAGKPDNSGKRKKFPLSLAKLSKDYPPYGFRCFFKEGVSFCFPILRSRKEDRKKGNGPIAKNIIFASSPPSYSCSEIFGEEAGKKEEKKSFFLRSKSSSSPPSSKKEEKKEQEEKKQQSRKMYKIYNKLNRVCGSFSGDKGRSFYPPFFLASSPKGEGKQRLSAEINDGLVWDIPKEEFQRGSFPQGGCPIAKKIKNVSWGLNLVQGSKYSLKLPKIPGGDKYYGKYVIVKLEGSILFIKLLLGAKPGNKVRIKITKVNTKFAIAKVIQIYSEATALGIFAPFLIQKEEGGGAQTRETFSRLSDSLSQMVFPVGVSSRQFPSGPIEDRKKESAGEPGDSFFRKNKNKNENAQDSGDIQGRFLRAGKQKVIPSCFKSSFLIQKEDFCSEIFGEARPYGVDVLSYGKQGKLPRYQVNLTKRLLIQNSIYQMIKSGMHLGEKAVKCNARMKNYVWNRVIRNAPGQSSLQSLPSLLPCSFSSFGIFSSGIFGEEGAGIRSSGKEDIKNLYPPSLKGSLTPVGNVFSPQGPGGKKLPGSLKLTIPNGEFTIFAGLTASRFCKSPFLIQKEEGKTLPEKPAGSYQALPPSTGWNMEKSEKRKSRLVATGIRKEARMKSVYSPYSVEYGKYEAKKEKKETPLIKKGRHIINLLKTRRCLNNALTQLSKYALKGRTFMFIGTKKPAAGLVARASLFSKTSFFVNTRWLGGMLTNWKTILKSISKIRPILKEKQKIVADILEKRQIIKQRLIKKALLLKKKSKLILNKGRILIDLFKTSVAKNSYISLRDSPMGRISSFFETSLPSSPPSSSPKISEEKEQKEGMERSKNEGGEEAKMSGESPIPFENIVQKTKKLSLKKTQLIENCYSLLTKRQNLITKRRELMYQSIILKDKGLQIVSRYKSLLNQLTIYSKKLREVKYLLVLSSEIKHIKNRAHQENKEIFNLSYSQVKNLVDNSKYNIIPNPPKDILNLILLTMTRNSPKGGTLLTFPSGIEGTLPQRDGTSPSKTYSCSLPSSPPAPSSSPPSSLLLLRRNRNKKEEKNKKENVLCKRNAVYSVGSKVLIFSKLISKFSRFIPYLKSLIKTYAQNIKKILNSLNHCTKILLKIKITFKKYVELKNIIIKELGLIKTKLTSERQIIRLVKAKVKHFVSQKRLIKFLPKLRYLATPLFTTKIMETVKILMKKIVDPKLKYPVDNIYDDKLSNNSKKIGAARKKKWQRLEKYFGGISNMTKMSKSQISKNVAIIIGQQEEMNAVYECQKLGIKMFNIVDTNCNPSLATHIIPANDDSKNSIKYILNKFLVRIRLSQKLRKKIEASYQGSY